MNNLKNFFIITCLVLTYTLSCTTVEVNYSRIDYSIPAHVNMSTDEIKAALGDFKTDPSSSIYIEIIPYSYSSGTETMSFSGGKDIKTMNGRGRIKALVKVMDGKKILRADFVEGTGNSKEEMLSSLAKSVKLKLGR